MALMAVKVLPLPVAIWIRARGLSAASEASRLRMAWIWAGQSFWSPHSVMSSGMERRRRRNVSVGGASWTPPVTGIVPCAGSPASQSASVAGWWKAKTGRERGSGSRPLVKRVSMPVDSYANGSGRRQAGNVAGRPCT